MCSERVAARLLSKIKKLLETQSIAKLNFAVTVIIVTLRRKFLVIVTMLVYVCVRVQFIYFSHIYTFTLYII